MLTAYEYQWGVSDSLRTSQTRRNYVRQQQTVQTGKRSANTEKLSAAEEAPLDAESAEFQIAFHASIAQFVLIRQPRELQSQSIRTRHPHWVANFRARRSVITAGACDLVPLFVLRVMSIP